MLSASKSRDSTPVAGRRHPSVPAPVVTNPGCARRSESTYRRPPASCTTARPLSSAVPASSEGASVAVSVPTGEAPLSCITRPARVKVRRDAGPRAVQRDRSRLRARSVRSRAAERPPSRVSTPSTSRFPAPVADASAAWVSSAAAVPLSRTGPATAPRRAHRGKLPRSPSKESGSALTSANTLSVSPRVSSPTVPRATLTARSPSRCVSVPAKRASCSEPVRVPSPSSSPRSATAGARRRTVPRSTVAASTTKGRKRMPSGGGDVRSTWPLPRMRDTGQPATSESRNVQSTASASAPRVPSAVVWPLNRPKNGKAATSPRGTSRSKSVATRSAPRTATSPESAAVTAVSRPVSVPPP